MQLARGPQLPMRGHCLLYHLPSEASALASPIFPGSCPLPDWATSSFPSPGLSFHPTVKLISLRRPFISYPSAPVAQHCQPCQTLRLVCTSAPASHTAQVIRAGRDHTLCDCVIDGNNEARSGEGIPSLVSGRVWVKTRDQLTYLGSNENGLSPRPLCPGHMAIFSCAIVPLPMTPLPPHNPKPSSPMKRSPQLPRLTSYLSSSMPCNSALITFTGDCPPVRTHMY